MTRSAPAAGGAAVQIGKTGGTDPVESADGKSIWYDKPDSLWKMGVEGSGRKKVLDIYLQHFELTPDGVTYLSGEPRSIWFFNFATGKSLQILVPEKPLFPGLSVSRDAHWLLYTQWDTNPGSELMLVEHFH